MTQVLWFEQFFSESLYATVLEGFALNEQAAAEKKLLAILELAARTILLEETEPTYQAEVAELLSSGDTNAITAWLSQQLLSITDALRERLERTILQIQAQLAAKSSSAILHSV